MSNSFSWFLVFLAFDLLLAAVRAALAHARLPYLISQRDQHTASSDRVIRALDRPRLRVSLRLAVVLVHLILAGLAWELAVEMIVPTPPTGLLIGGLFLMGLVLLFFEYLVEGAMLQHPESWAARLLWVGQLVDFLLQLVSGLLMRLLGTPDGLQRQLNAVTDDELKSWVDAVPSEGSLETGERKMIYSIMQFGDTLCREVMVPRIDVFGLEVATSISDAIDAVGRSGHSRIPVYNDTIDQILGILYAKDLLRAQRNPASADIRKLLRPPYYVPEAKKVDELLREMQLRGVHMAIVVDEYGGTAGIVTLEDIVEEIVGDIRDEYDQAEELPFQMVGPDEYSFIGRVDIEDVNELLGTHLTRETADTLGGYIYGEIGRIPTGGEELRLEDWDLTVEQVSGRRIRKVRALRRPAGGTAQENVDDTERRDQTEAD